MGVRRRLGAALVVAIALLGLAQVAQAKAPKWSSVRVQKISPGVPWTEPRITTGPDGTLWLITNGEKASQTAGGGEENSAPAIVMYSTDHGRTWHQTKSDPNGQTVATPDVDIATLPSGRVIASELDDAGINFPSAVSDDRGKTWQQAHGSNQVADQDRQWLASGPVPGTGKRRVYLLFHNLASGNANHNMFVAPSDDGGKTFGVPVPITLPGEDAYNDLQCADSGGPSTIFANQRDGTVYAEFTTRGTPIQGTGDLGGCATPAAGQPLEFNIVAGTRVWLAQSKDGGQTWTKSLPVDYAKTGQIVSMQVAYAGLDTAGNVYVAYPKSPVGKKYPDYSGGGVIYKWAHPAPTAEKLHWSPERTFEPPDAKKPGHVLVHMSIGDPGRIMAAYWEGTARSGGRAPIWYMKSAQTLNGLSAHPKVTHARIFSHSADTGTASELMGACMQVGPVSGIINGLFCDRSPDVWGVTLDPGCRMHIVWPAVDRHAESDFTDSQHVATDSEPGTWVSNQVGGSRLCAGKAARAKRCRDRRAPVTHFAGRRRVGHRRVRLHGRAHDRGCVTSNGLRVVSGLSRVRVSVALRRGTGKAKRCRYLKKNGHLTRHFRRCRKSILLRAKGKRTWHFSHKVHLPRGHYRITARSVDRAGNREKRRKYNSFLRWVR